MTATVATDLRTTVRGTARELLGFGELRPGQEAAAAAVLAGRDVLAVMPTGSGKSAIYQIAGVHHDGPTVVVSPLIALQHDQVESIGEHLGGAAQVNSTVGHGRRRDVLHGPRRGDVEFVFVAPEQLANDETAAELRRARTSLVVVDEAHCISTWGHDFRPDYRQLGRMIAALGRPPVLALTATAAPPVRADIIEQLELRDPVVVVAGFERPNIHLDVVTVADPIAAWDAVEEAVHGEVGTGIVYVATWQQAEELASQLDEPARPALAYHGGLPVRDRTTVHERFQAEEACVVVATTAFGMGIDVAHVRFVVHAEVPESLDTSRNWDGRDATAPRPAPSWCGHASARAAGASSAASGRYRWWRWSTWPRLWPAALRRCPSIRSRPSATWATRARPAGGGRRRDGHRRHRPLVHGPTRGRGGR